jgi:NAD(P)-dependent dehydrogenase (short-subunit alcohol dehydrogenase family)
MKGRVCIVTGATSGIGRATAEALAATESTLVIHGRDAEKTDRLLADLKLASGRSNIHRVLADFSSLEEVAAMAAEVRDRFGAVHVLINNAGVLTDHRRLSADGFEWTFAVNHLAPFLLTNLLLDLLTDHAPARIATNSSSAMGGGRIDFLDLQSERGFDGWQAYANTKLANVLFSNLLASKLADTGVVSNSFCPGLIDTNLLTGNSVFGEEGIERLRPAMRAPGEGAVTPVFLATAAEAGDISGQFFLKTHGYGKTPLEVRWDRAIAERLWSVSRELVQPWLGTAGL